MVTLDIIETEQQVAKSKPTNLLEVARGFLRTLYKLVPYIQFLPRPATSPSAMPGEIELIGMDEIEELTKQLDAYEVVLEKLTADDKTIGSVSDGYHTFDELYEHRCTLFIALCKLMSFIEHGDNPSWKSKLHSDGTSYDGWFILGYGINPGEQITYHLPAEKWDECDFALEFERAPEFDGHTQNDVLERLRKL
ncbi:MAG: hypothetical protein U0264_05345 [Candidatus Kapaibacterium sp.]